MEKIILIHGDVSLYEAKEIPKDAKKLKWHKGFIIEKGEGVHTHTIEDECEIYEKDGALYLKIDKPVEIDHEEHGKQTLEPGIYRKDSEQEFNYEDMEIRNTQD